MTIKKFLKASGLFGIISIGLSVDTTFAPWVFLLVYVPTGFLTMHIICLALNHDESNIKNARERHEIDKLIHAKKIHD